MPRKLTRLKIREVSMCEKGMNQAANIMLFKAAPEVEETMAEKKTEKKEPLVMEAVLKALPEELQEGAAALFADVQKAEAVAQAEVATLKAELETARTELAKKIESPEEPTEQDMLKDLPVAIRKRIEDAEAEAAEAKTIAKAERSARQLQEFTKQAETDLPDLPAEASEKGRMLQSLTEYLPEEDLTLVKRLLKAGSEAMHAALVTIGRDDTTGPSGQAAYAKMEALATEIRKTDPGLSMAQAMTKAMDANPKLYGEYLAERQLAS